MTRVYLEYDGKEWKQVPKSNFWIDRVLLEQLNNLKKIQRKKWDGAFIIDGPERSGKSVLGLLCAWYLSDCKVTVYNFALGLQDVAKKIAELPDESVILMDEGSTIFASRRTAEAAQKNLMDILDVVGQKRLFFIIILPCFFDLNKTIAVRRTKFLLHVYPDENYDRGRFVMWGEMNKGKLYRIGKKNFDSYSFPKPDFPPGEYFEFHPPFWEEYEEKIKKVTLNRVLEHAVDSVTYKAKFIMAQIAVRIHKKFPDWTQDQVAELIGVNQKTISEYLSEYGQGSVIQGIQERNK